MTMSVSVVPSPKAHVTVIGSPSGSATVRLNGIGFATSSNGIPLVPLSWLSWN